MQREPRDARPAGHPLPRTHLGQARARGLGPDRQQAGQARRLGKPARRDQRAPRHRRRIDGVPRPDPGSPDRTARRRLPRHRAAGRRHRSRPRPHRPRHVAGDRQEPRHLDLGGVPPRHRARWRGGKRFWRQQSAGQIVQRWAEGVGADHVTVITVPPPGAPSELLWQRFCQVAGIAAADWVEAPRANESLGAPRPC